MVLAGCAAWCDRALAIEFGWLEPANTQVIVIDDPYVDFALRIAAIDRARSSIDSLTYTQGTDPLIGKPILQAFRRAQSRGLEGRYLSDRIGSITEDPHARSVDWLADKSLRKPGQAISFGGLRKVLAGLKLTDMVHEKILIIDGGTPNELIWIGGRNNTRHAGQNLDLGILLRRIDPSKPYVGDQIRTVYENTWDTVSRIQPPRKPVRIKESSVPTGDTEVPLQTAEQKTVFERVNVALSRPVDPKAPPAPFELRPARMRAISNDFLAYAATRIWGKSRGSRTTLPSDIVDAASLVVARSKVVYASLMSVFLPEGFKEALKTALRNGAEVHLLTNSKTTHRTHTPFGLGYEFGLDDIEELMQVKGGRLRVYILDEELLKEEAAETGRLRNYLHRKLIIADGHVFTGSDNFNDNSRSSNSEMVVQIDDPAFTRRMVRLMAEDLRVFRKLPCQTALTEFRRYGVLRRGLNRLFMPFY